MNLRQKIEREIRERGPIPFSRYMELCLYDPELGYYSRNGEKFGKAGDFYTSSDVHAVFGRVLARQFEEMWRALGEPELGALLICETDFDIASVGEGEVTLDRAQTIMQGAPSCTFRYRFAPR